MLNRFIIISVLLEAKARKAPVIVFVDLHSSNSCLAEKKDSILNVRLTILYGLIILLAVELKQSTTKHEKEKLERSV